MSAAQAPRAIAAGFCRSNLAQGTVGRQVQLQTGRWSITEPLGGWTKRPISLPTHVPQFLDELGRLLTTSPAAAGGRERMGSSRRRGER